MIWPDGFPQLASSRWAIIGIVPAGADEAGAALRKPRRRCRHANDRIDAAFLRSRLQRPSTQLEQPIAASDSPLPKALGAAILESQTEGIQGMSAKTADLRRR
jgi:hypothetical protein